MVWSGTVVWFGLDCWYGLNRNGGLVWPGIRISEMTYVSHSPGITLTMAIVRGIGYPIFFIYIAPWVIMVALPVYLGFKCLGCIISVMFYAYIGMKDTSVPLDRTINSFASLGWLVAGAVMLLIARKKGLEQYKKHIFGGATLFVLMGGSYVVEVCSSVQWYVWWLLVWRVVNALSLLGLMMWILRKEKIGVHADLELTK